MRIDPTAYWARGNRGLLLTLVGVVVVTCAAMLGPAGEYRRQIQETHADRSERFNRWQDDFRGYHPITDAEREGWRRRFADLRAWLPVATDEPSTMAEMARLFEAPSTRDLQVQPGDPIEGRGLGIEAEMVVESPLGNARTEMRAVPLQISFTCSLADLRTLLHRLEARQIPVLVEALRVRRLFGELDVRIDLVLLVKGAAS